MVQSDEQVALIFSEMLVATPPPPEFHVTVEKEAMINAIGLTEVTDAVKDFGGLYQSIADSQELVTLISRLDPISSLSAQQRKLRVDAANVARLWHPIEARINTGLLCFRNGIGRYYWLSTAEEAADGSRALINLCFDRWLRSHVSPTGTKIDVWREREPRMRTHIRLTHQETTDLEAILGGSVHLYLLESVVKTRSECDCSPYFTQLSLCLFRLTES